MAVASRAQAAVASRSTATQISAHSNNNTMWASMLNVLLLVSQSTHLAAGSCTTPPLTIIEKLFNASTPTELAQHFLANVQNDCKEGKCPQVTVGNCEKKSVDDFTCPTSVTHEKVKLGTDEICNAGCSDWPCKAGCQGIDVGICYAGDYVLCKAGCFGISSCVHKCEHAIVDPCKDKLIHQCEDKCEAAFNDCKRKCEESLTMDIGIDFERMQRALTSMSIDNINVTCSGNQILKPLLFNATAMLSLSDISVDLTVHTLDAGISSTNGLTLDKVALKTNVPFSGIMNCVFEKELSIAVGNVVIKMVNLDVDLHLQNSLDTIVNVICADLPVCKDAIKGAISIDVRNQIERQVPQQVAQKVTQLLQGLVSKLKCPKIPLDEQDVINI